MSLDFLDNLLESANDNPELTIGAGVAAFATIAVTAYYTCCRQKATDPITEPQRQRPLTAQQQLQLQQKQQQQQLAHEFEVIGRNQGKQPPVKRNQLK